MIGCFSTEAKRTNLILIFHRMVPEFEKNGYSMNDAAAIFA